MGRTPCCDKQHTNKGAWSKEEDQRLINHINLHGEGNWRSLPQAAGLLRCGKSCRLRWINYLRPDLKRGNFTQEEDDLIIHLHSLLGNKWSLIAARLPGRTDNEIKNYWNTHLKRQLYVRGIDPTTHGPPKGAKISSKAVAATTTTTTTTKALTATTPVVTTTRKKGTSNNKSSSSTNHKININKNNNGYQYFNVYLSTKVNIITDSTGEDSNSSSGVTAEEANYSQLNLDLSLSLPSQPQVVDSDMLKPQDQQQHQVTLSQQYVCIDFMKPTI